MDMILARFRFMNLDILPCMILIAACVLIIVTLPVAHRKFCRHQVA